MRRRDDLSPPPNASRSSFAFPPRCSTPHAFSACPRSKTLWCARTQSVRKRRPCRRCNIVTSNLRLRSGILRRVDSKGHRAALSFDEAQLSKTNVFGIAAKKSRQSYSSRYCSRMRFGPSMKSTTKRRPTPESELSWSRPYGFI